MLKAETKIVCGCILLCFGITLSAITGLPKALQKALECLAPNTKVKLLEYELQEHLSLAAGEESLLDPTLQFSPNDDRPLLVCVCWSEGVEGLNNLSEDELWKHLGLTDKTIPFFNAGLDPEGNYHP